MHNMKLEEFYSKIKQAIEEIGLTDSLHFWPSCHFLTCLNNLMEDLTRNEILKMTCMSVLFEGFYRAVEEGKQLKKRLSEIRVGRWRHHYGTPTITFLLTYNSEIKKTRYIFGLTSSITNESPEPWELKTTERFSVFSTFEAGR